MEEKQEKTEKKYPRLKKALLIAAGIILGLGIIYGVTYFSFNKTAQASYDEYHVDLDACDAEYDDKNRKALNDYFKTNIWNPPERCTILEPRIEPGILGFPVYKS